MDNNKTVTIAISGNLFTDQRIIRIASTLSENGYKVSVYYRVHSKYKTIKKVEHTAYPFKSIKMYFLINSGIAFYLFFNLRLLIALLFKKQSILCAVDADTLPAFTLLSKFKKIPLIYDAHEYFAEVPELENNLTKKKIWHWITRIGIDQSECRYTVSESLAIALEERYGRPFHTIRNVPYYKEKDNHSKYKKPTILYQGALNKGRELELLIQTMKKLPEFHCLIIGEGDLSDTIRSQAKDIENIEFLGLLSPIEINIITQKVYFGYNLLNPVSKSYFYSLSNKYFDYMQAGVPSLSSFLPEYELLNKAYNCGICIHNNENEIIKYLKYYYENEEEYIKLHQNALLASLKNNWEKESQKLIEIYNCL